MPGLVFVNNISVKKLLSTSVENSLLIIIYCRLQHVLRRPAKDQFAACEGSIRGLSDLRNKSIIQSPTPRAHPPFPPSRSLRRPRRGTPSNPFPIALDKIEHLCYNYFAIIALFFLMLTIFYLFSTPNPDKPEPKSKSNVFCIFLLIV